MEIESDAPSASVPRVAPGEPSPEVSNTGAPPLIILLALLLTGCSDPPPPKPSQYVVSFITQHTNGYGLSYSHLLVNLPKLDVPAVNALPDLILNWRKENNTLLGTNIVILAITKLDP